MLNDYFLCVLKKNIYKFRMGSEYSLQCSDLSKKRYIAYNNKNDCENGFTNDRGLFGEDELDGNKCYWTGRSCKDKERDKKYCNVWETEDYCNNADECSWVGKCIEKPYAGWKPECHDYISKDVCNVNGCPWTTGCITKCKIIDKKDQCTGDCFWTGENCRDKTCYDHNEQTCEDDKTCQWEPYNKMCIDGNVN